MFLEELQHAVRNLSRSPRFSLACVLTLGLALSGTATLLNMIEALIFRRLSVPALDRLIGIYPVAGEFSVGFTLRGSAKDAFMTSSSSPWDCFQKRARR